MSQNSSLSPENRRIDLLDIYRGFAIFGIFVVNIEIMNCIPLNQDGFYTNFQDFWNQFADEIRRLFFYSKFFPIFSLLFGLGIAMQIQKRKHLTRPYRGFIHWRMFTLLLIGIGHILFLWSGDVVHMYAIIGFFIPFIHRFSMGSLLIASGIILLGFTELGSWILSALLNLLSAIGSDPIANFERLYPVDIIPSVIGEGTYMEGVRFRFYEYLFNLPLAYSYFFPLALSMIVLGVAIGKSSFLRNPQRFIDGIKIPVLLITIISNLYRLFFLYVVLDQGWHHTDQWGLFSCG
ncbi:DUF418 domain-containing protein [Aureitalea marina]|uniref:DUF418 domain-containing protein n=1 Tax=Aureitalea marina TaxID=930804 RepID=UPI000CF1FD68|nr:hypothetical protein [Aureitalea marina]